MQGPRPTSTTSPSPPPARRRLTRPHPQLAPRRPSLLTSAIASLRPLVGLLAAATYLLAPAAHAAAPCPTIAGGNAQLAAQDPEARLAFIRARLAHDARKAVHWTLGFGTSYAVFTGGVLAVTPFVRDRASVPDLYVNAGAGIIGFGLLAVSPLRVVDDQIALEATIAAGTTPDTCQRLALAESYLIRDAQNEAFGRGWLIHSGNVLVGVGALLVLGLGYDRWGSGIGNGLGSIAVGELMILTQPHGLVRDLRSYRSGDLRGPQPRRRRTSWMLAPNITPYTRGLTLIGRF
jgi:hypothetical protein